MSKHTEGPFVHFEYEKLLMMERLIEHLGITDHQTMTDIVETSLIDTASTLRVESVAGEMLAMLKTMLRDDGDTFLGEWDQDIENLIKRAEGGDGE